MACNSVSFVQPRQKTVDLVRPHAKSRPTRKNVSNVMSLISRRYGIFSKDAGTLLRKNMKILRQIVLQDTTNFTKVWAMHSKSPIAYESGRIYFENYRCCYSSLPSKPQFLYELPKGTKAEKLEDALLCQCPLSETLPAAHADQNPCLLALAANNWLYRFSIKTGEQLQKVYLSPHHKFRYLDWDVAQEIFYVKSVQNKQTTLAREAGVDQSALLYLAVFKVVPLELVGVLEISRRVFGSSVVDVTLSQGVLAVTYSSKVKLYSFENIVQKYRTKKLVLGERCQWNGVWATVGQPPFGIPVNITITDELPVLFEMSCSSNGIQIGGHPWHYIFTPNNKRHQGTHHICCLQDGSLAKNGIQDMNCCSLESDWIYFHPDDSGRIIHVGPSTINVLKMVKTQERCSQSEVVLEFPITAHRVNNLTASKESVTSSGRVVKRRYQQLDDDPGQETFRMVEYEDELDLLAVVEVMNTEEEGQAHVCLHDNQTGMFKKKIPLVESWDVTYSHKLFFDLETIIHIEQKKSNQFCCHVYKITCGRPD